MNDRNNPQRGGSIKSEKQQESDTALWTAGFYAVVTFLPSIIAFIAVMESSTATKALWVERGWLAPAADAVLKLSGGVAGLDVARLTLPIGNLLIAAVVGLSSLAAFTRREKAAPYWFWQRESLTAIVCAVWAVEAAPAVFGIPAVLGWLVGFWAVLAAVGVGVLGVRANRRHADRGRLIEQIAPLVGDQIKNRDLVGLAQWSQQWPTGIPGKVVIKYPNATLEADQERQSRIVAMVSRIGWGPYRVESINARKHQLVLTPGEDPNAEIAAWHGARSEAF